MATFTVSDHAYAELEKKLAPLAKRAAKLGLPAVTFRTISSEMKHAGETKYGAPIFRQVYAVEVEGVEPIIAGYEFAAKLDLRDGAVIIRKVPTFTEDLPERFRSTDYSCDHCRKSRRRTDIFVIRNAETGEWKQVGRSCIKDFLGSNIDPGTLAALLEELGEFFAFVREEGSGEGDDAFGGGYGFGDGSGSVKPIEVLVRTAQALRMYGWISRSAAGDLGRATADRVSEAVFGKDEDATDGRGHFYYYNEKWTDGEAIRETVSGLGNLDPTDADRRLAEGTFAYVASLPGTSDFEWNIKSLCGSIEYAQAKDVGMLAAAVMVYERHLGNEAKWKVERERKANLGNGHVGEIGKRMSRNLMLIDTKTFEGDYGVRTLVTFVDDQNNVLKWWTGSLYQGWLDDVERGTDLGSCDFTPKKHGDYQGTPETTITRVSPTPEKKQRKLKGAA